MACAVPQQCAPRFKTLLRLYLCLPLIVCGAGLALSLTFLSVGEVIISGCLTCIGLIAAIFLPGMLYERIYYTRHARWLKLERGLFVRTIILVPRGQIICTRLRRGPLERMLGLSTVILVTTAGRVAMPGLTAEDGAHLRRLVDTSQEGER